MRPRVIPAEDARRECERLLTGPRASMRPRVIPAEDGGAVEMAYDHTDASMRPRVIPAEDHRGARRPARPTPCFNEAAGNPRGRRSGQ